MKGYYHTTENSGVRIDENNWLHSGDIAIMDENGYVRMTGRVKDMISRGVRKKYFHVKSKSISTPILR